MSAQEHKTEAEIIRQHTIRSHHGPPKWNGDGDPPVGSVAYFALPVAEQLRISEQAVGIYRDGDDSTGAIPTATPRQYGQGENNPIDTWRI